MRRRLQRLERTVVRQISRKHMDGQHEKATAETTTPALSSSEVGGMRMRFRARSVRTRRQIQLLTLIMKFEIKDGCMCRFVSKTRTKRIGAVD